MNLQVPISSIMTKGLLTISPEDSITKVENIFRERYIHHLLPEKYEDINFKCEDLKGDSVSNGIAHYADQIQADLMIRSKIRRTLVQREIDRSQTKPTLLKSNIPVMVVHNDDHDYLFSNAGSQD